MGKLNINNGGIDTNKVMPDIDERFGPYASIEAANTALSASGRDCITAGLTVGITQGDGSVEEYWYQPQGSGLALVPKQRLSGTHVAGDFASFDANGDIVDSGHKHSDYATSQQGDKADTAYQKPSGGIPATDLASAVQTSLGKADTAIQSFTVGTTTTGAAGTNASVTNSGTATNPVLNFTIPRGIDGQDGQDGADAVNPFKGWWPDLATLKAAHTATEGDSAYVKDADPDTTWSIYIYDSTASSDNYWADSGTDADTSSVQTFASGQEVNEVSIVDNIETDSSTDVLTAKQGKLIADTTMQKVKSINLLDPLTIKVGKRIKQDGTEANNSSSTSAYCYGCTDYLELTSDGLTCNHSITTHGASVYGACVYNASKQLIGSKSNIDGDSLFVSTDNTTYIDRHGEGVTDLVAKYVRFNLYLPSTPYDGTTDGYAVYKGTTLPSSFVPYVAPHWEQKAANIQDGAITTAKIADAAVTIDKMADTVEEYASDNILNPDTCVFEFQKYISFTTGNIGTSSSSTTAANGYTDYIPIDSRGIVFNHGVKSGTSIGAAVYYLDGQGNKVFKRGNIGSNNGYDQVIVVNYDAGDQSLPDSDPLHYPDAFVRFTISNAGAANNVMCNIGTVLKDYVPYGGIKKTLSPDILPNNDTNIEQVLEQEKIFTDALKVALPDKFYAVRGDVFQLFHKGVVYAIDFANRYAMPTCSKGTQYRRYYELDTTKVVFVVSSSVSVAVGDVYSTQGNTYEVTKVATEGSTKSVTCTFKGSATITSSGTLTKVSGSGDSYISYTKFTDTVAAGEYPYTLTIYDDNRNILGEGSSIIKLVNFPTAPQSTKRILCIGASTTAGGQWVCEAQRRLLGTGVNPTYTNSPQGDSLDATKIKFIGSISKTLYGQSASFFAKSGWSWEDFATEGRYAIRFYLEGTNRVTIGTKYTNNGHTYEVIELNTIDGVETIRCSTGSGNTPSPHGDNVNGTLTLSSGDGDATLTYIKSEVDGSNPFWNSTLATPALDFQNYIENICGETGLDMMIIVLGANAMFTTSLEQQEEYVRTFVEACHADYPDCKIILVGSSSPSMINMLPGYGVGGNSFGNTYLVKCRLLDIFEMYKNIAVDYDYVEFESWAGQFDSDYNFPLTQKAVNTRNDSVTEPYANNTIHPGNAGYMQYADAAYRTIVAHLCQ